MKKHKTPENKPQNIPSLLLRWYDKHARILPWRETPTPYRVWVSEIMLQQTRVETVKPYFERFLSLFPDIQSLAKAEESVLLKSWEGLGYYNRVRNLQKSAKIIVSKHNGMIPDNYDDLIALPGIGDYTAGAILSISFGLPFPAVDGNVVRVITRLTNDDTSVDNPSLKKKMNTFLSSIYPKDRCGDFTQALMELGATVCLPNGEPHCSDCPLKEMCLVGKNGRFSEVPAKKQKPVRPKDKKTVLMLFCKGKIAIRKRPERGLLSGLWEFPVLESHLTKKELKDKLPEFGIKEISIKKSIQSKHIFTHREWIMQGWIIECADCSPEFTWCDKKTIEKKYAIPSAFKEFFRILS